MRVGILVFEGADELDVVGPHRVLGAAGFDVELVAEEPGLVTLSEGLVVAATVGFVDCPPLGTLLVSGGSSADTERGRRAQQRNRRTLEFLSERAARVPLLCSVCTGAFILAEAGLLAGRRVNTHWQYRDELAALMRERGESVEIVAERVVWDDSFVSCGGVTSGIDLALEIVERQLGPQQRVALEAVLERETPVSDQAEGAATGRT